MDRLRAALTRAAGGTASAGLMSGDAGVGKSRMLEELVALARTEGAVVLHGRCSEARRPGRTRIQMGHYAEYRVGDVSRLLTWAGAENAAEGEAA